MSAFSELAPEEGDEDEDEDEDVSTSRSSSAVSGPRSLVRSLLRLPLKQIEQVTSIASSGGSNSPQTSYSW